MITGLIALPVKTKIFYVFQKSRYAILMYIALLLLRQYPFRLFKTAVMQVQKINICFICSVMPRKTPVTDHNLPWLLAGKLSPRCGFL